MPESPFTKSIARVKKASQALNKVGASPVEAQVLFLKGLVESPAEAKKFQADPKGYAVQHGILLDPRVVNMVVQASMTTDPSPLVEAGHFGDEVEGLVQSFRGPGTVAAMPAAVAAGAAVVMAAAAVVTMVVTLVRAHKLQDLQALRGLGAGGIVLPGGQAFKIGNI